MDPKTIRLAQAQIDHAEKQPILYRLYTEDKANLSILVGQVFDGATFLHGFGYWKGRPESSCVIEILGTRTDIAKIRELAHAIRLANGQEQVLIISGPVVVEKIEEK